MMGPVIIWKFAFKPMRTSSAENALRGTFLVGVSKQSKAIHSKSFENTLVIMLNGENKSEIMNPDLCNGSSWIPTILDLETSF